MQGTRGVLVGLVVFAIGFLGLAIGTDQLMTHADPNAAIKAVAGLGTFVAMSLVSLVIFR